MERREAIRKGNEGLALTLVKPAHIPADQRTVMKPCMEGFYAAWEEASLAQYGGEHKRAHYYFRQALQLAPEDIEPEALAEVIEGMNRAEDFLAEDEQALPWFRAAVERDPKNSEQRFRYALLLCKLGCEDEAAREVEAALEHPETLCQQCLRDCWNNLGWYLYRQGEYAKALPWFERAATIKEFAPIPQERESALAIENIILVYVTLNMVKEAREAAVHYIAHFGRLPWPERRALLKLNINADALYIEHCGHTV
jgi:tetratricopeptide (TPR) repeat protein